MRGLRVGFLHVDGDDKRYRELAKRMVASVKASMPGLEIVQMTDTMTPAIQGVDDLIVLKPKTEDFMPYRLEHLALFQGDAIFLDTDVVVRADLREAFQEPFDVGLTKRSYPVMIGKTNITDTMPYNTGVMFSRSPQFFWEAYRHCQSLEEGYRRWFGDQVSIYHIAKSGRYKVKEFPCEIWNRVPVRADDLGDGKAIHYKGTKRKQWMVDLRTPTQSDVGY